MASPTFLRWQGVALLIGSLIVAVALAISLFVPGPLGPSGPPAVWDAWISAIGGIILLIGLPALYTVQSKRTGMMGLLGPIGLFVGVLLIGVVSNVISAIAFANYVQPPGPLPTAQPQPPLFVLIILLVGSVLLIAGSVLFGLATLRSKAFANWTVWALIVLSVLSTLPFFLPFAVAALLGTIATILFLLLFAWFGYTLVSQTNKFAEMATASS